MSRGEMTAQGRMGNHADWCNSRSIMVSSLAEERTIGFLLARRLQQDNLEEMGDIMELTTPALVEIERNPNRCGGD